MISSGKFSDDYGHHRPHTSLDGLALWEYHHDQ